MRGKRDESVYLIECIVTLRSENNLHLYLKGVFYDILAYCRAKYVHYLIEYCYWLCDISQNFHKSRRIL